MRSRCFIDTCLGKPENQSLEVYDILTVWTTPTQIHVRRVCNPPRQLEKAPHMSRRESFGLRAVTQEIIHLPPCLNSLDLSAADHDRLILRASRRDVEMLARHFSARIAAGPPDTSRRDVEMLARHFSAGRSGQA